MTLAVKWWPFVVLFTESSHFAWTWPVVLNSENSSKIQEAAWIEQKLPSDPLWKNDSILVSGDGNDVSDGFYNWSMEGNGTERNSNVVQDEFKGWMGAAFKAIGRGAQAFGKASMKFMRVAGKALKKAGKAAWKMTKKGFRVVADVAQQAMYYAPDLIYQLRGNPQAPPEEEGVPCAGCNENYPGQQNYDDGDPSNKYNTKNANLFGLPTWVIVLIVALVLILIFGGLAWLFLGGKADYRHRQNLKHRRRRERGRGSDSDSDSENDESEAATQTQMTTVMTTRTEAATTMATEATTTMTKTTAPSTMMTSAVSQAGPVKGKGKKKKRGLRRALDQIEKSIYGGPAKKKTKGKKKTMMESTMTEPPTATVTEAATEVDMSDAEPEGKKSKSKSKSAVKKSSAKKSCAIKKSSAKKASAKKASAKKSVSKKASSKKAATKKSVSKTKKGKK